MIGYDVYCYRCRNQENGRGRTEADAREAIEDFKRHHRSSCGSGASFSISTYQSDAIDSLLGVVEPPAFPEVDR